MFQFTDKDHIKATFEAKDKKESFLMHNLIVTVDMWAHECMHYHLEFDRYAEPALNDPEIIVPGDEEKIEFYKKNLVAFQYHKCGCVFVTGKYNQTSCYGSYDTNSKATAYDTDCPFCGEHLRENEKLSYETYKRLKENYKKGESNG